MKKKLICLVLVLAMCLSLAACGTANDPDNSTPPSQSVEPSPSHSTEQPPEDVANQKFEGYYTNNTDERPPVIQKILNCIENQPCKSDALKPGTTHGDIIYYFVEDPNDCFPSAKHPVYSVIIDVSDFNVFDKDGYGVSYIISFDDIALDLWYTVSYDFSGAELMILSIRDLNTQETLYGIGYPDVFTAETWDYTLSSVVAAYMPGLCVTVPGSSAEQPSENWEAPYCPGEFSKIGETFSEFYVAGSGLQYSPDSLYILMVQEYALNRAGWEAYTDYNGYGSRVGVANDRIVLNVQEMASGTRLSEALPSDMLNIVPLISYGTDEYGYVRETMLIWKGDNGYMVGFTEANGYPNGNYLNEYVKYFISTIDLGYIFGVPEAILTANPAFPALSDWAPSSAWGQTYIDIIADAMTEFPQYQYFCSYSMFDIDKDGTPELFLKVGTCEADYQLKLYRYSNGVADCIATLGASHAVFCGLGDQKAFLIDSGHQGYEVVTKYSYNNGNLSEEILFEGAVQNYHEFSYLPSFELDDYSGLEWTANEPDNNQNVIDNYFFEDNVVAEAEITSENFEQVVPLIKRSEWYDNGIFSSYFASCDHQNDVTWEYIGTTADIFGLSYYDYTEIDVYRVDYPDGWKSYLFVPYSENIGNPPVVFLFFDSIETPWEIWNGSY